MAFFIKCKMDYAGKTLPLHIYFTYYQRNNKAV